MFVILRPDCSPAKASAVAAGGANAQPHKSATAAFDILRAAKPAAPLIAKKFLRSMIFLQGSFVYVDSQTRSRGKRCKSIAHALYGRSHQFGPHFVVLVRLGQG